MDVDTVSQPLLAWYDRHARTLPWRSPPGTPPPDPYRVWLSEVMLQQTGTLVVSRYFARFTELWPSVEALAAVPDADVLREWAGLGYYARARNLIATARAVAERGGFPDTEAALRELPGVGAYTAAAIAAIAFDRHAVVVDGNVERVVARLFAVETELPKARPLLHAHAATLTPRTRCGDYAQAVMDLGATVCTPRAPACERCPVAAACAAYASGAPARFPLRAKRAGSPVRHGTAWWIEADGAVLLVRRAPSGLLGGMLALPGGDWSAASDTALPFAGDWRDAGTVRHVFTHFELRLRVMAVQLTAPPPFEGEWVPVGDMAAIGLPALYARAARLAVAKMPHPTGVELPVRHSRERGNPSPTLARR